MDANKNSNDMEMPGKNTCQRCEMPMHHLADFGSNKDGTINTEYCRDCYSRGVFVDRGISLEERIEWSLANRKNESNDKVKI